MMAIAGDDNDIIRSKGDFPPRTYIFKVESFSKLSELMGTEKENVGSLVFKSGGHKWKLVLYPNGDTKRNGEDHVSLYLAMAEESVIPDGFALQVRFKFFIYDHIRDDYLIIQYGKAKCFHASKREHGFNKLLPLSMFTDASNGYLANDACVFGVDVNVSTFSCRGDRIRIIENPENGKYTWNINGFSKLKNQECLISDVFAVAGRKWKLLLYPRGNGSSEGKYVSLILQNIADHLRPDVYAECNIMLKTHTGGSDVNSYGKGWFTDMGHMVFSTYLAPEHLYDPLFGFLANDSMIVEVEIEVISAFEAC